MSADDLDGLWELVRPSSFFQTLCACEADWDRVLDARDDEFFDQLWTLHHVALQATPLARDMTESINLLREHVFKEVLSISRNADLAGYVSDDFGLIAHHLAIQAPPSWVTGLLDLYVRGNFPHQP
ncbi:hypothetical protein [Pseudomonas syringae]|uniref:hypothetical protein n=1 Tax=Pseudomonas syringae TaxID=317 RepID=UPI001F109079|nr:hypothetical protein [Pseudomonas syringae pv. lapsa]